jgi:hypothetical protein
MKKILLSGIAFIVLVFVAFADSPYSNKPISPPEGSTSITTLGTVTTGTWEGNKIGIGYGGTNATNATDARTNLGLGTIATQNSDNVTITGGNVTGLTTFSAATTNIDHIGEKTSGHGVVVDNNITVSGAVTADTMSANVVKTTTTADATLSGTPIIITVYDAASNTPYYFKAYPTK